MAISLLFNTTSTYLSDVARSSIVSGLSSAAQSSFVQLAAGAAAIYCLTRKPAAEQKKEVSSTDKLIQQLHGNFFVFEKNRAPYIAKTQDILRKFPRAESGDRLLELELKFIEATGRSFAWDNGQKIDLLEILSEILTLSQAEESIVTDTLKFLRKHDISPTPDQAMGLLEAIAQVPRDQRASVIRYADRWIETRSYGEFNDLPKLIIAMAEIRSQKGSDEMTEIFLDKIHDFFEYNYWSLSKYPNNDHLKIEFLCLMASNPKLRGKPFEQMKKFAGYSNQALGKITDPANHITLLLFMSNHEEIADDLAKIAEPYWMPSTKCRIFEAFDALEKDKQAELAQFLLLMTRDGQPHDDLFLLIEEFSTLSPEQIERVSKQIERLTPALPAGKLFTIEEFRFFVENDRENLLESLVDSLVEYFNPGNPMTQQDRAQFFSTYSV